MNASGDAAEQIVRMTLEGVQVAAKITGDNVERLANLLIIALKDNSNTSIGKASLTKMLKTNKPIKFFEIKDEHLRKFFGCYVIGLINELLIVVLVIILTVTVKVLVINDVNEIAHLEHLRRGIRISICFAVLNSA